MRAGLTNVQILEVEVVLHGCHYHFVSRLPWCKFWDHKFSVAKCQEPSQVVVSGQEPFFFNFCNSFKHSKRGETEAVRVVFEEGHVLELLLLGSQLN